MKKFLFGVAAMAIIAAGTNFAINVAADRMNADDLAASLNANDIRIQQRDARVAAQKSRVLKVDTTKLPIKATTTTSVKR
jgi:hypothetical protein